MAKVDIESVKPNSHKYKEEQKQEAKKEKVISGSASRKKKSEVSKLANSIVSEDVFVEPDKNLYPVAESKKTTS